MSLTGGCYCGAVRYEAGGVPLFKLQCHCRECQYIAGGSPNLTMGMAEGEFRYTKGTPATYSRADLDTPVAREFCGICGTHLLTRSHNAPGVVLLKIGTLDDPAAFEGPQIAIYTSEMQPFHHVPEGLRAFEKFPG